MKKYLFAAFAAAGVLFPLSGEKLEVASYRLNNDHLMKVRMDPTFSKLTDGKIGVGNRLVVWDAYKAPKKLLKFNFKFATPVTIDHVDFHVYRGVESYGWWRLDAFGFLNGQRMPLGRKMLKHPYSIPDKKEKREVIRLPFSYKTPVTEVEFNIDGSGRYCAISEVIFEGTAHKPAAVSVPVSPYEKLAADSPAKLNLRRVGEIVVLENRSAIYAIDPKLNGGIVFAWDKMTKRNIIPYVPEYEAGFLDRFHGGGARGDLYDGVKYSCKVIADTPQKKQVTVSGAGKGGNFFNVRVSKTYTLEKEGAGLRVDCNITNDLANVVDLKSGYWMKSGMLLPEKGVMLVPGVYGVETSVPGSGESIVRNFSGGWFGGGNKVCGAAYVMPYELMKEIYFWATNPKYVTAEGKLGIYPIKAGESLNFTMFLVPYSHVGYPDKVSGVAAASFDLAPHYGKAPEKVTFRSRIFSPGKYTLKISGGIADRKGKVTFRELSRVQTGGKELFSYTFANPFKRGTAVFKAELYAGNAPLFFVEKQSVFNTSSGIYTLTPDGIRKPDLMVKKAKLDLNFNKTKTGLPAFDLARKYAGGVPKVLAVNAGEGGIRDMIEVSRRCQIDLVTNFISGIWSLSGHFSTLERKTCINELTRQLKKEYDCMLFSANVWEQFSKDLKSSIMAKVAGGTGLILVAPEKFPAELEKFMTALPVKKGPRKHPLFMPPAPKFKWQRSFDSPLISGVPVDRLPATPVVPFAVKKGTLHIKAGKNPLLSEFSYGKGKVFLCAWAVTEPGFAYTVYRDGFFLPINNVRPPEESWKYYEYQISLLGKLIYAASGKSAGMPAVKITAAAGDNGVSASAVIDSPRKGEVTAQWVLRNKYSVEEGRLSRKITLAAGRNTFSFTLPAAVMEGVHFADLRLIDSKGAVLWWGSAAFDNKGSGKLVKVLCDTKKVYKNHESIACTVTASGRGVTVTELWDANGNLMEKATGSKALFPLKDCRTKTARLVVRRMDKGQELDRKEFPFLIYGTHGPGIFTVTQGWPGLSYKAHVWNYDVYIRQLKKFGINRVGSSGSYMEVLSAEKAFRKNGVIQGSVFGPLWTGAKFPYTVLRPGEKVKDKMTLIRKPCLSSPRYQKSLRPPQPHEMGPAYQWGALESMGGDESNSIIHWDGCFSEHCLKAFRVWLKKEYKDLAALNKSWKTSFKRWDDVIASTSDEARKMDSFASWLDHRTFNDQNLAEALRLIDVNLKKLNPKLFYSLSGTQETNPWNSWDHYLRTRYMGALSNYVGEQTIQQRCFAKGPLLSCSWHGYDRSYEYNHYRAIRDLMNGSTGFSIFGKFNIDPAFNISPGGEDLIRAFAPWIQGKAEAVMKSVIPAADTAFHYSPGSIKADWFIGLDQIRQNSVKGFKYLMSDSFLHYDYAAYGDLETKGVPERYKVLVLPCSTVLSDGEVRALAAFVKRGGTLVADLMPGFYDQHGAVRENTKLLYEIFGMKKIVKSQRVNKPLVWGKNLFKIDYADLGSVPGSAKSFGTVDGKPAFFVNRYGKGKAVYFGASVSGTFGEWENMRYSPGTRKEAEKLLSFWQEILKHHRITPLATVSGVKDLEVIVRSHGSARILAVLRDTNAALHLPAVVQNCTVKLDRKYHVYDMLSGKYLGYKQQFVHGFLPATQGIFALLPEKVEKVTCGVKRSGRRVTLSFAAAGKINPGVDHLFKVRVFNSKGVENESFAEVVFGKKNKGVFEFALPLNKGSEKWSARITELYSGVETKVSL